MSVHNVDEILWLTERMPTRALATGSRLYSHALTTSDEDFDDALLCLWFGEGLSAQVQVSRNHVSGYRVETILFGEEGQIHVGRFDQRLHTITVEAYGRRGRSEPLAFKTFAMRDYHQPLPEFVDRFGNAYKAELATFIECCRSGAPFPVTHRDGLRAQQVISAGMRSLFGATEASEVN
jgi:predicted dehydrogenase